MRGFAIAILGALALSLGVACTTSVQISFDPRQDFSHYRTWNWLPAEPRSVDAPTPYIVGLERTLALLVAAELERAGLEQVPTAADLRVGVLLNVRHETVTVAETGAVKTLSSLHASPSFEVQTTMTREETYDRSRLVIFAIDPKRGRVVWRGTMEEVVRGNLHPRLERTVANLLERFPSAHRPANRSIETPEPDPDPGSETRSMFTASPSPPDPDA